MYTMTEMTIAQVKRDLPQVKIKIGKRTKWARITGRLNAIATVTISGCYSQAIGSVWEDRKFSWESVAQAINTGNPLSW